MCGKPTTEYRLVRVHRLTVLPDLSFFPNLPDFRNQHRLRRFPVKNERNHERREKTSAAYGRNQYVSPLRGG
jgi:hypothetical protein